MFKAIGGADLDEVQSDSITTKAHPVASTGRWRCLGRSRGGLSTKAHVAGDRRGRLLKLLLTAGQKGDAPLAEALLSGLKRGTVGHVIPGARLRLPRDPAAGAVSASPVLRQS